MKRTVIKAYGELNLAVASSLKNPDFAKNTDLLLHYFQVMEVMSMSKQHAYDRYIGIVDKHQKELTYENEKLKQINPCQ